MPYENTYSNIDGRAVISAELFTLNNPGLHARALRPFLYNPHNNNDREVKSTRMSGGPDHEKAQNRIFNLLSFFYYRVVKEQKALVDILSFDDDREYTIPYSIDVLAMYPRSEHKGNWTIRFDCLAVEIDNSSKKIKGKTGHKSKRAFMKDEARRDSILAQYGIDVMARFEATDISQTKRWKKLGIMTILEELGITKFPHPSNGDKRRRNTQNI